MHRDFTGIHRFKLIDNPELNSILFYEKPVSQIITKTTLYLMLTIASVNTLRINRLKEL